MFELVLMVLRVLLEGYKHCDKREGDDADLREGEAEAEGLLERRWGGLYWGLFP